MDFRTLDPIEGKKQALAARMNQLEQEYLSNETALLVAQSLPEGEAKDTQVAQFTSNLVVIESAHGVIVSEHDSITS
jgi:hypothetical protein